MPVAGGVCEEESTLRNKASILDSSAASRMFSHLQMLHLRVLLKEPTGLRRQAVAEAWVGVHLHFEEHHGEYGAAGFGAARGFRRPEDAIEAVAQFFELQGLIAARLLRSSSDSGDRRGMRDREPARWQWRLLRAGVSGSGRGRSGKLGSTSGRCLRGVGAAAREGLAACGASFADGG